MANPVLVEVTRGDRVESAHRGSFAISDPSGTIVSGAGEFSTPIYPRSAVKAAQAMLLVESGAADHFGFGDRELALAGSSHSAEPEHVDLARSMLERAGLEERHLECGTHWPGEQGALIALAKSGAKLTQLHNNCSGKHAGFLCAARHLAIDTAGYVRHDHTIQREVASVLSTLTGHAHTWDVCGTDGCSIPTYAVPLDKLAQGYARMATGAGLSGSRRTAAWRLLQAAMSEPFLVAGSRRACTLIMQAAPKRVYAKGGAEGVYCAAIPELGFGIALKMDDGAMRGAEALVPALLAHCLAKSDPAFEPLMALANRDLVNCNSMPVGTVRVPPLGL